MNKIHEVTNPQALFISGGILGINEIFDNMGMVEDQEKEPTMIVGYANIFLQRCLNLIRKSDPEALARFEGVIDDLNNGHWERKRFEVKARKAANDFVNVQSDKSDLSMSAIMGAYTLSRFSMSDIEIESVVLKKIHDAETPKDLIFMDRKQKKGATSLPYFLARRLSALKDILASMEKRGESNWVIVDYGKIISIPEKKLSIIGRIPAKVQMEIFGVVPTVERAIDAMEWDRVLNPMIDRYCVDSLKISGISEDENESYADESIINLHELSPMGILGNGFALSMGLSPENIDDFMKDLASRVEGAEDKRVEALGSRESDDDTDDEHENDLIALGSSGFGDDADDDEDPEEFPDLSRPVGPALEWEGSLLARVRSLDLLKKEATVQLEDRADEITIPLSMKNIRKIADAMKQEGGAPILVDAQVFLEPYWRVVSVDLTRPIRTEEEMIAESDFL